MTRSRVALAAALLLVAIAALWVPAAGAQTPTPSPSPSSSGTPAASPSPSASSPSATAAPASESLALLMSAEPETIEAGHETVIVAQVTNTGDTVADAQLEVVLPDELELVNAFPRPATPDGRTMTFALGSLAPGDSAVVQITTRGIDVTPAATVAATATAGAATATDSVDVMVVVTGAAGGLTVTSRSEDVLTQVGSMVRYVVTVTNDGSEDLEDVLVVDLAPEELEVVSVDIVEEVEAVQIGESLGRYDIVWNVGALPVGASVDLPWDGRAVRPGDLTAVNSVRGLLGQNETIRSTSRSYLAAEGRRDVDNPRFEPIEKRVVRFVDPEPVVDPQARATTEPVVVLPFTGASLSRFLFAGIMFVIAGALIAGGARLSPAGSGKTFAAAALAGLVLVACVSGDGDSVQGAGETPRTFGTDDPRTEEPRVKGERIVRGEDGEATAAPTDAPSTPAPPAATPAPATATPVASPPTSAPPVVAAPPTAPPVATNAPEPEPVRVVDIVRIGLEDLPVETLGSRAGDNTVSFGWDESAGGITSASSGTRVVRGAGSELLTDLTTEKGAIVNSLTLTNTHDDARLDVEGRLVHEVYSGGRLVARLRSAPIDEVLAPGGSVVARFSYLVPAGDYVVEAHFESSQE